MMSIYPFQIHFLIKQNYNVGSVKFVEIRSGSYIILSIWLYGYHFILGTWLMVFNLEKYVKFF